jgi:nucleotide-binding universal stress UspA family protein
VAARRALLPDDEREAVSGLVPVGANVGYRPPQRRPNGPGRLAGEASGRAAPRGWKVNLMSVVVAHAPTPEGRAALARAGQECRLRDVGLVIVRTATGRLPDGVDPQSYQAELDLACKELEASGVSCEVRDVDGETPAEEILSVASQASADIIVIGLRRRTPVGKLLLGSNAQRILLDAECPVLAVKADATAAR